MPPPSMPPPANSRAVGGAHLKYGLNKPASEEEEEEDAVDTVEDTKEEEVTDSAAKEEPMVI